MQSAIEALHLIEFELALLIGVVFFGAWAIVHAVHRGRCCYKRPCPHGYTDWDQCPDCCH